MNRLPRFAALLAPAVFLCFPTAVLRAADSLPATAEEVNKKMVKIWGSGGLHGLPAFSTGVVVSADGYILTANTQNLDTPDLRVHLSDGTKYRGVVVAQEPELDIALIKIGGKDKDKVEDLPFFDLQDAAKHPSADVGTGVLAFSNCFEIATRDDPVSVQHAVVTSYAKLQGRNGFYEMPFTGKVYMVDTVTNNPGSAGGALTTRKGDLIGIIGRGLRNELTGTWMNYSIPVNASVEIKQPDGKTTTASMLDLLVNKEKYKRLNPDSKPGEGYTAYSGIVLVADPVEITPPYVEDVEPGSPAAKAGLQPDDLIVYVDGVSVKTIDAYKEIIKHSPPNREVQLEVRRGDKLTTIKLTLADVPKKK